MEYDTRAFGELGLNFMNSGEKFRKLKDVSAEDRLMITGIFKQATMGDCTCEAPKEAKRNELEIQQHSEWMKHKGMDLIDAMKLYMEKVAELIKVYPVAEEPNEPVVQEGA